MAPSSFYRSSDKSRKADDDDFVVVASAVRSASTKASTTPSEGSSVKKRKTDDHLGSKPQSLFPLFNKKMSATVDPEASSSSEPQQGAFVWLAPLGPSSRPSCLRASLGRPLQEQVERRKDVQGQGKVKVACFDLDGCLVVPRNGKVGVRLRPSDPVPPSAMLTMRCWRLAVFPLRYG